MTAVDAPASPEGRPLAWWGMALVVATESALFAVLLATAYYLRFSSPGPWPPDGIPAPSLGLPIAMTLLLAAAAAAVASARQGARRDLATRLRLGLATALVLGIAFLVVAGIDVRDELRVVRPGDNAYGSIFYVIDVLHAVHVLVGVLLLGWALVFAIRGAYDAARHDGVQVVALYWSFVTVVWLLAFATLYLVPRA